MPNDLPQITIDWINKKWVDGGRHCPFCGENDFSVADRVYEMPEYSNVKSPLHQAAAVIPVVIVVCKNCGVVFPINAVIMEKEIEGVNQPNNRIDS